MSQDRGSRGKHRALSRRETGKDGPRRMRARGVTEDDNLERALL